MKLAKMLVAAAWVVGVTLASAAYADPPAVVGRLNYVSGPVSFAPAEAGDEWVAATLNRPITTGDRLWTDNNAFAEIHVGSLAIRMAPQTSMDVLNLDDSALQLRVAQGDLNLRVRRLVSGRLIEVATPDGSVVVRQPGSYRISVDADSSTVTVRAGGQAEVFTAGSSVLVRDTEEVAISRSRPELFAASQPDEFDRWAADRDRRHDRVASTRYVPVEMTGYEDLDQYGEWRTVAEYGNVWIPSSVPTGWAPYRYGHWVWISPWGWTWVDDQPWGFAPSHYGRWVWYDNYWAWAPGRIVERPVYSPALVAFIGGSNFSVSVGVGPAVGWVPLGYREPYIPWYSASRTYVQNVNIAYVTNVTNINTTNIRYVNRTAPGAVTVVSRDNFVRARPVQQATINVPSRTLATEPVTRGAPVSQPATTSLARSQPGSRPPAQVLSREAVVVNRPPAVAQQAARVAASAERLPVRVIERRERLSLQVNQTPRTEARAARSAIQPPRADAPAAPQRQPQAVQEQRPRDQQTRQQEQAREQQGDRLREQKRDAEQQQKAQAQQQADQIERERKQRAGQQDQAREQQRTQQQERERGQKAAQEQQRAQQEQQRAQQAAQKAQQEQQRAQQEQQRAQQEQQRAQQAGAEAQKAQQEAQRGRERERAEKAAQEQQRAQQEQQRAQQAAQKAQQEQQRAQQEQQRAQQAAHKAQQEQQRAQQEQQRAQQAAAQAQKAQQEQQRAQQAAQQAAAREARQRAQKPEAAQAAPKPEAPEAEKGNRERGRKADKD